MSDRTQVIPNNARLFKLVKDASQGKLALPQFQRSFVWRPDDIKELLVSVFKGYFIGALLVMDMDPDKAPFGIRPVEGCEIDESELKRITSKLLLDGQQRITSMYYAFYAPDVPLKGYRKNSTIFFLNLREFLEGNIEEAITYNTRDKCKLHELERGDWQYENLVLPLRDVLDWHAWSGAYMLWLASMQDDQLSDWALTHKSNWDERVLSVFGYETTLLSLPKIDHGNREQLEEICTIFEKLNSTGVQLNVFDLLTARLYPEGIYIDTLWQEACEDSDIFTQFSNVDQSAFGLLLLRFIGLVRNVDVKSQALINLSPVDFESDWRKAVQYFDEAYMRLISLQEDGFGVFNEKWLPHSTIIPVLAALLAKRDELQDSQKAFATRVIQWWYWGAVFTVRYTGSVETVSVRDYGEICRYIENQDMYPEVFRNVKDVIIRDEAVFPLFEVERASNTIYKGVMCLLARNGAKDFRHDESIAFSQLEDHHIFPQSFVKSKLTAPSLGLTGTTLYNTIVNRTLISAATNRSISNKAPSVYLHNADIIPQDRKREILGRHFIDTAGCDALENDNYEEFLRARQAAIVATIRSMFEGMP